ncbi:MAG TPA: response regulator [Leptolyngbya sp.]|jgi:CheY-like chemotaxis protein|nr:response regulator [Leptolyngbya sp.]
MTIKQILVIDDEPYVREVIQICLETTAGWEVITAGSGNEGLVKAETEQPDAILLDVMMPGMNGITTFQNLQSNAATQEIPVIVLTAKMQFGDRPQYLKLGLKAAIAKPFDPLTLASEIAQVLDWDL